MMYILDPTHSEIDFKIKHLKISTIRGKFKQFFVSIGAKNLDFSDAKIFCEIDACSIDTGISERDYHLRNAEFFDVINYPKITFRSNSISPDKDCFLVTGTLSIKGQKGELTLKAKYNGSGMDEKGKIKHGFDLEGEINIKEWELGFDQSPDKRLLIDDEVFISASIQMEKR